jgi:hypothetical protein
MTEFNHSGKALAIVLARCSPDAEKGDSSRSRRLQRDVAPSVLHLIITNKAD